MSKLLYFAEWLSRGPAVSEKFTSSQKDYLTTVCPVCVPIHHSWAVIAWFAITTFLAPPSGNPEIAVRSWNCAFLEPVEEFEDCDNLFIIIIAEPAQKNLIQSWQ